MANKSRCLLTISIAEAGHRILRHRAQLQRGTPAANAPYANRFEVLDMVERDLQVVDIELQLFAQQQQQVFEILRQVSSSSSASMTKRTRGRSLSLSG